MQRCIATAIFGALLGAAPLAGAADDASVREAGAQFKEGLRLFKAGDFERARMKFTEANALVKSKDILWNLALSEAKSGHAADAINHFRAYERDPKARPADVHEADTKWIPPLEPQVGELQVDGAEGAPVKIDGTDAGVLPLAGPVAVTPGDHHLEARSGGDVIVRDVGVAGGQTIAVHLVAVASEPAVAVATPSAALAATPSPATSDVLSSHVERGSLRVWLTVGLGAGALALAAGTVYFGVSANNAGNDANALRLGLGPGSCPGASSCAALSDDISRHNSQTTLSYALGGGAVLFAGGALLSWFLLPHDRVAVSGAVVPLFGAGTFGAGYARSF